MGAARGLDATLVLLRREVLKWVNRRPVLVISLATPIFWIALFGKSFNLASLIDAAVASTGLGPAAEAARQALLEAVKRLFGTEDYFTYVATGMLAVFALFQSMFGAVGVVFDKRIGYMTRLLVAPIPRASIFAAKVLGSLVRITVLAAILLTVAALLGLKLKPGITPLDLLAAWLVLMLLSAGLSSLFTGLAFNIENQEVLFALANLINLPLMFSSSALFPREQMPEWLRAFAGVNPISHAADLIRYFLIGKPLDDPLLSAAYLAVLSSVLAAAGYLLALRGMREA